MPTQRRPTNSSVGWNARHAASLGVVLLEHLAFEEEALAPVLASWTAWPSHD